MLHAGPNRHPGGAESAVVSTVETMLSDIASGREEAAMGYMAQLDGWPAGKSPVVTPAMVAEQTASLPEQVKEDVQFQHRQITEFARHQMASMHSFEVELPHGVTAGQRVLPVAAAGCYVPGGRFSHVSSAIMSCATAKVAGVANIVAVSPPMRGTTEIHPATLYAMYVHRRGGGDTVC